MKKQMRVGLVVEGNATASPVLRLRSLREELGPLSLWACRWPAVFPIFCAVAMR